MTRTSRRQLKGRWRRAAPAPTETEKSALAAEQIAHLHALERDLEKACARYERAIEALDEHSAELERHPRAEEIVAEAMNGTAAGKPGSVVGEDAPRLTDATFKALRSLGLSVTQAKRIIAMRERGVLKSTADLESVPGLPAREVTKLRRALRD